MAKCKTTRKWISDNYNCCSVGYCDAYYLLYFYSADYYTAGVYGWNFDAYTFGSYCITTGYRGMIDHVKTEVSVKEYNDRARKLVENNRDFSTESQKELKKQIDVLISDFLSKTFGREIEV